MAAIITFVYILLSLRELNKNPSPSDVDALLNLGGFPEPLLTGSSRTYRCWSLERLNRVVYTDINDLENIKEISHIELLVHALNDRVGSPLSVENLRQDLQVSHNTVSRWLDILPRHSMYGTGRKLIAPGLVLKIWWVLNCLNTVIL